MTILAGLLLTVCTMSGPPVPQDKLEYIGTWTATNMTLTVAADGHVDYERIDGSVTKTVKAPITGFTGDDFSASLGCISTTFDVSAPPHLEDGVWKMTVDDVVLTRITPAPTLPGATAPSAASPVATVVQASAEDGQETPLAAYQPVVPDPSRTSTLPCPAGTRQHADESSLVCRGAKSSASPIAPREGPALFFHLNGKVQRDGSYAGDQSIGRWWEFDDWGRLVSSNNYASGGQEDGLAVTWHPNGKRRSETMWKDGQLHGATKIWSDTGELQSLSVYEDGKNTVTKIFAAGQRAPTPAEVQKATDDLNGLLEHQRQEIEATR